MEHLPYFNILFSLVMSSGPKRCVFHFRVVCVHTHTYIYECVYTPLSSQTPLSPEEASNSQPHGLIAPITLSRSLDSLFLSLTPSAVSPSLV